MTKTKALKKFTELYQASETQDSGRCITEVVKQLIAVAQQESSDPGKMLESVETFQLICALAFDDTENGELDEL
jgi:hypothetical protein